MTDRHISFEGVRNFRDFGGYATPDGAVVRGKLYRTASFAEATESDLARLDAMGVRFVVDLRRPEEREEHPNRWPGAATRMVTNDAGYVTLPAHVGLLTETDLTAESVRAYMHQVYTGYPFEPRYVALFRSWLHGLDAEGGPAVVHCAAGKDRTGLICALTLTALGVHEDDVIADYELTNRTVDIDALLPQARERMSARFGRELSIEALRPMFGVHPDYLASAYTAIHDRYPDLHAYMDDVLGVDAAMQGRLRARFVG